MTFNKPATNMNAQSVGFLYQKKPKAVLIAKPIFYHCPMGWHSCKSPSLS